MDRLLHHDRQHITKLLQNKNIDIVLIRTSSLNEPAAVFRGIIFGPIGDFVVKRLACLKIYTFASSNRSRHVKFVRINSSCAITVNKYSVLINGNFTSCNKSKTNKKLILVFHSSRMSSLYQLNELLVLEYHISPI